jgi:hypothetical protein
MEDRWSGFKPHLYVRIWTFFHYHFGLGKQALKDTGLRG